MASSDRIDELKRKFDENPRRYFAPLANEFRKGGDLEQAILICQEFLPQQPGHMSGHIVYGQALYESDRLDEARGVFETALSLDPENLIALRHLGDIAGRQGDATAARRWYERVLEADPRNDEIQSLLGKLGEPHAPPPAAPQFAAPEPGVHEHVPSHAMDYAPEPRATPEPFDAPELLDLDVSLPGMAPTASASAEAAHDAAERDFAAPTGDVEPTPETADLMPALEARADGFEATEFAAPDAPVDQTPGLQSSYEVETGVHPVFIGPMSGLDRPETTVDDVPRMATSSAFPELDEALPEDHGEVLPPHGDPIADSAPAPADAPRDEGLLDFDMPLVGEAEPAPEPASEPAGEAVESLRLPDEALDIVGSAEAPAASIPPELPPQVIAAEAELMEAGAAIAPAGSTTAADDSIDTESVGGDLSFIDVDQPGRVDEVEDAESPAAAVGEAAAEPASESTPEPVHAEQRPFVTETMAELYLKQGFRQEALSVYEQLSTSSPSDERLAAKVAALRAERSAPKKPSGPPVREFFARLAARRPGERAAASAPPAEDDFAPSEPTTARAANSNAAPSAGDAPAAATAPATGGTSDQRPGGTIDALFGNRPIGSTEDSAASALAQAFGAGTDAAPISGNPARPATGELTLDSVFREGGARGPRTSQGFSFDQFFSQTVDGDRTSGGGARTSGEVPAPGEPAERSEDDIEQFNSWLQGLKQR
ncbi:MAG TPA: tetratricopeptide repeat protein [Gemmatimonadaceae bacterium]|nr:tetratricopeptide repeat protein [Gemmatimonadaceae bacterium]